MNRGEDEQLQESLGYVFRDPVLLDRALTHSSGYQSCEALESRRFPSAVRRCRTTNDWSSWGMRCWNY